MNCLEFRRLLLLDPRHKGTQQEQHAAECPACARLAADAASFDAKLEEAALVPVPDALAERVLLRRKMRPAARYGTWALAASLLIAVALGVGFYETRDARNEHLLSAATLGTSHPAVAAISYVLDHEPQLLRENRSGDPAVMQAALRRLGLSLPQDGVTVRYLGKCPVPGGSGDHVVLSTPHGQVTLILIPEYPVGSRVMVADRNVTAVMSPARDGGYIVVAASPRTVRQIERMLL